MNDERLNGTFEDEGAKNMENINSDSRTADENSVAPEKLEAFIEDQINGDIPEEEESGKESPVISTTYSHSTEENDENETGNPPEWQANENFGARINMQVKKKKRRKWIIGIVVAVAAFYLLITGFIIVGVISAISNSGIDFNFATGRFEIGNGGNRKPLEAPQVEEHLQITPTPKDEKPAPVPGGKLSIKQIAEKVRTSVVGVIAEGNASFSNSSVGSGIIMSKDGYIITNNHVIENMNKISVVTDDGKTFDAHVIGTDPRTDLAVLKVDATDLPAAEFGDSDKLEQGDLAVAIGNPAGIQLQNTVTSGIISAINRNIVVEDEEMTLIQTDASINPGNSGGPLVNEYGQVIGINTVKIGISYYEGLGFAIPINTAKPIIDELISRGYITGRPSIGISGTTLTERDAAFYGLKAGMYVEFVHPYSDAYKKGLQAGDVIIAMNDTPLTSKEEIKKIRDKYVAGDTVKITVYRQGREFDINVVLMDEAELNKMGTPSGSAR